MYEKLDEIYGKSGERVPKKRNVIRAKVGVWEQEIYWRFVEACVKNVELDVILGKDMMNKLDINLTYPREAICLRYEVFKDYILENFVKYDKFFRKSEKHDVCY